MTTQIKTKAEFQKELAARFFRAIVLTLANELERINALGGYPSSDEPHWPREDALIVAANVKRGELGYDEGLFPLAVEMLRLALADDAQRPGYDRALQPNPQLVNLAAGVDEALEAAMAQTETGPPMPAVTTVIWSRQ